MLSSNNSVTVGQGYSTIAGLPNQQGNWALPLRHERITSHEKPISKATWQLKQASRRIKQKVKISPKESESSYLAVSRGNFNF